MSAPAKRQSEALFEAFDDPAKKIFDHSPGKDVLQDFQDFVKRTGKPHEWRYHLHTEPPQDAIPQIVLRFTIPEAFKKRITKAPCPICSLPYPKYWEGVLTYYPDEKALRAIGHECGRKFFAEGVYDAAIDDYDRKRADQVNLDFLLPNLPKVAIARRIIQEMSPRARILDRTRSKIKLLISQRTARALAKHAADGFLKFYEDRDVPMIGRNGRPVRDGDGNVVTHIQQVVVETIPFSGAGALGHLGYSIEALFNAADSALEGLEVQNDDEIEDAWLIWGEAGRAEAVERIRKAWGLINTGLQHFQEIQAFLRKENIENLSAWSMDSRAPFGIPCRYDDTLRKLEIAEWGKKKQTVPIAPEILAAIPAFPSLE